MGAGMPVGVESADPRVFGTNYTARPPGVPHGLWASY